MSNRSRKTRVHTLQIVVNFDKPVTVAEAMYETRDVLKAEAYYTNGPGSCDAGSFTIRSVKKALRTLSAKPTATADEKGGAR